MFRSVLVVCAANVCRSPMAEGVLLAAAAREGIVAQITSAGVSAIAGRPPATLAVEVASRRGINISAHRSRPLLPEALREVDLCLFMENRQRDLLGQLMPSVKPKLFTLGHWKGIEILDPMGQPIEAFENTLSLIETAVASWLPYLTD